MTMPGTLYLVATPIGNLKDITFRAVEVLKAADLIACEDTRHTRKLLNAYEISTRLVSYHEHNEAERADDLSFLLVESRAGLFPGASALHEPLLEGHHALGADVALVDEGVAAGAVDDHDAGLAPLQLDDDLAEVGRRHGREMFALGYFGHTGWQQSDEGTYLLAPGMHVVTVYGYDDGGVYLVNPGRGNYDYYAWGDFLDKWSVIDGMAMAVAPM